MSTNTTLGVEHGGVDVFRVVIDPANPANDKVELGRDLHVSVPSAPANRNAFSVETTLGKIVEVRTGATVFSSFAFVRSALIVSSGSITVSDATSAGVLVIGTSGGTHLRCSGPGAGMTIGDNASEKVGFHGVAGTVQGAAIADATGAGDVVATANAILARMRDKGLIGT